MNYDYQLRYWNEMGELKTNILYLGMYLEETQKIDRIIKMFLAVASNGSIAAWVIWKDFPMVWGGIIAASQFLNAVKEYLPYQKRAKSISGLHIDLQDSFLYAEKIWFSIAEGEYTEKQINEAWIELKKRKNNFVKKHLGEDVLPENKKLLGKADEQKVEYFKVFYK